MTNLDELKVGDTVRISPDLKYHGSGRLYKCTINEKMLKYAGKEFEIKQFITFDNPNDRMRLIDPTGKEDEIDEWVWTREMFDIDTPEEILAKQKALEEKLARSIYHIVDSRLKIVDQYENLSDAEQKLCYYLNNGHNYYLSYPDGECK